MDTTEIADCCGLQARILVGRGREGAAQEDLECFYFCGHCYREREVLLTAAGFVILDSIDEWTTA